MNFDHMQSYSLMDISLDTFPYHNKQKKQNVVDYIRYAGTTTTCEALWMGVPVVTLVGKCHAQNVGASLLTQIGYESWICNTEKEYIDAAIALASDLPALAKIRNNLRGRMERAHNGKTFTRGIEQVYRMCWEDYVDFQTRTNGWKESEDEYGIVAPTAGINIGVNQQTGKSPPTLRAPTPSHCDDEDEKEVKQSAAA